MCNCSRDAICDESKDCHRSSEVNSSDGVSLQKGRQVHQHLQDYSSGLPVCLPETKSMEHHATQLSCPVFRLLSFGIDPLASPSIEAIKNSPV